MSTPDEPPITQQADRGRAADQPTEIPPKGLRDVVARVRAEIKTDQVSLLAAGIAFYSLLAMVPAMVAVISVYGLAADPQRVRAQVLDALSAAPREVREVVSEQLESIVSSSSGANIAAVILGGLAAIWSASAGIDHLVDALNVTYDETEKRPWLKRKLLSLGFTLGAIVFVALAVGVIAVFPRLIARTGIGSAGELAVNLARWVVLLGGMVVGLSMLYRWGPDRADAKWRWVTPGAVVAAVVWVVGSIGFSLYTANFASYNETYGSLGAIVVVMLWLFLTAMCVLIGAEINSELERQTAHDSTTGAPRPLGDRDAYAADTVGGTAQQVRSAKGRGDPEPGGVATVATRVGAGTSQFQALRFAGLTGWLARLFGVRRDRAYAVVDDTSLTVRYGAWVLTTPVANIADAWVTGPYAWWRVAGPPRLSWRDAGVTLATNRRAGMLVSFHEPVACALPFGLVRHRNATVTVDDPAQFVSWLDALRTAAADGSVAVAVGDDARQPG
jgi:membrane protein